MRLELSNSTPCSINTPQIIKKLYQPYGILRIKYGCYGHTCFFYYAALDSVKLHHHSTRSQHRLSRSGTCFNWLNEGLFVQCFCPPCSCIPAFMEFWRRNQACHEGKALWVFSHHALCPSFVIQFSRSCPTPPVPKW